MSLDEAFEIVTAAGYKISRPRATRQHDPQRIIETNPLGHAFPHAKLRNVTLSGIGRLRAPNSFPFRKLDAREPWHSDPVMVKPEPISGDNPAA